MLHYKRLLKEGAQTRGVVMHVYVSRHSATGGNISAWLFPCRVTFDDGSAMETSGELSAFDRAFRFDEAEAWGSKSLDYQDFERLGSFLQPGATVPVRYDPQDHTKLVLDKPAFKAELLPKLQAKRAGREAADAAKVARTEARLRGENLQAAGSAGHGMSPAAGPGTASAPAPLYVDVADELSKLADLRDRGVITDAEFEGQKKKILGG
jgi:hypothetical protein